jgi:hypothetical protein
VTTGFTSTTIANLALREIGTYRIEDFNESSPEARVVRDVWDQVVRSALEAHEWTWAKKYAALSRLGETPAARWTYAYGVPDDFVRLVTVSANSTMRPEMAEDEYEFLDEKIYTDAETPYLAYVYSKTTVGTWPAYFVDYVAVALAARLASVLKATTERERLEQLRIATLGRSRSLDSVQTPIKVLAAGQWRAAMMGSWRR